MIIAIIPARSGSKRIPDKNIKLFMGKPIIHYSINAAVKSGLFDKVIVSTDSEKIAKIAHEAGAETPFMRPMDISDDFTPLASVFLHALKSLKKEGLAVKYICGILATAPFIRISNIKQGYSLISREKVSSVFSITTFGYPIFRSLKINPSGHLEMFWPEHEYTRSNDLPEAYYDAGQFYWLDAQLFQETPKIFNPLDSLPIVIPRYLVQDIDTIEDWVTSEIIYETCKRKGLL